MDNASRYFLGITIGMFLGAMFTMWMTTRLTDVRTLATHRVSVDNDRHIYWCSEYEGK